MNRDVHFRHLIIFFLLLNLIGCTQESQYPEYFKVKYKTLQGKNTSLSDFGGKIIALHFWSSDCQECKASNQIILDLLKDFKNRTVILGVNTDKLENQQKLPDIALKFGMNYDSLYDPDLSLVQILEVERQPALVILQYSNDKIRKDVMYDLDISDSSALQTKINEIIKSGDHK